MPCPTSVQYPRLQRLALLARATVYNEPIEASGPIYESMKIVSNKIIVTFQHTAGGLVARGEDSPTDFTIAGEEGKFVSATAEIHGDTVVVSAPAIVHPVAVRYGWADYPRGNLWNKAGLPASPFRTDSFPLTTDPKPSPAESLSHSRP